ncbi:MAG: ABC transporter substrate-binding protein [Roseiflexaceae bacterium]|nr:ABC transporter substrate-binding protein [Roseiflexaceae bacterium]
MTNTITSFRSVRFWTLLLWLTIIALNLAMCGAPQPKTYRVGVLSGHEFTAAIVDGFKESMTDHGFIEGEHIIYDVQQTTFDPEAYRRILRKFLADNVDLILVFPTEASFEAKTVTAGSDIPVIFSFAQIEGLNIVDDARSPGGNMTGVRYPGPEIAFKRFQIMREIAPQAKRILIPYLKDYPTVPAQLDVLRPAALSAGVTLVEAPVATPAELAELLEAQISDGRAQVDAILHLAEPLVVTPDFFEILTRFANEHQLPMGGVSMSVDGYESLFDVNPRPFQTGKNAALLASQVLRGVSAGDLPVISDNVYVRINYRAAQRMGISVSDILLQEADEVIQ